MIADSDRLAGTELKGGYRNLLESDSMRHWARVARLRCHIDRHFGAESYAVRGILFDKQPGANWNLGFHQDRKIAVRERIETSGYSAWSVKEGVVHVEPPAAVLERMLAVRIHLDDCPIENGPLLVLPGTHTRGKLNRYDVRHVRSEVEPVACVARSGGALTIRPLLVHASSRAAVPTHRRVLHFEFAAEEPEGDPRWHFRV